MIISTVTGKASDKTQYPFIRKSEESRYRRTLSHYSHWWQNYSVSLLKDEKLKAFPLKSGTRRGYPLSPLRFNTVLKTLARAIKQWKQKKGMYKKGRSHTNIIFKSYDSLNRSPPKISQNNESNSNVTNTKINIIPVH